MGRDQVRKAVPGGRISLPWRAVLLASAVLAMVTPAAAQVPKTVRVVTRTSIVRWFPNVGSDVLATVDPGTELDALDQERGWYWVIAPADDRGTRRGAWIAARDVEAVPRRQSSQATTSSLVVTADNALRPSPPPSQSPSPSIPSPAPVAVAPAASSAPSAASVRAPRSAYSFEDVHFDRNRAAIRPGETKILDDAANQLMMDPQLRLNVEGHTCNLGTAPYNLVLGDRRAKAVKDYLVSKGVSGDRLRTMSFGETKPKHDNSQRATRPLNRRVALVPELQP